MFEQSYRGKNVLVTGHTGFKGSWLALWLHKMGANVAGFSAYIPSQPANFEVIALEKRVKHIQGDIRNLDQLRAAFDSFRPDMVFHLAAQPIVTTSYDDPKLTFDTNVGGTVNVLEAVRNSPSVRAALCITSDKCYENVEWEYGYRETDRLGGKDPYSASKAGAEAAISAYARSFFNGDAACRIASVRAGNVIGGGDWAKDRIVPDCVRAWADGRQPEIRNPRATRPWQHVLEPLGGYLLTMSKLLAGEGKALHGQAFNFGPAESVNQSVAQLIASMGDAWGGKTWKDGSDPDTVKKEAGLLRLNCDKARHRLGWRPLLTLDQATRMTIDWYIAYYGKKQDMYAYSTAQVEAYEASIREQSGSWGKTP